MTRNNSTNGDSTEEVSTDGGAKEGGTTFRDVNWSDIDRESREYEWTAVVWTVVAGLWILAAAVDAYTRVIAGGEPVTFPVVGSISAVDWMWGFTLLALLYYGVVPLLTNRRLAKHYWKEFRKNKAAVISGLYLIVILLVGIVGSRVIEDPSPTPGLENQPPAWMSVETYVTGTECVGGVDESGEIPMCQGSWEHPLGTTNSGEDILRASIHGMEISLQVGLIATMISIALAAVVGMTAAYKGGLIDEILMRYVDIQLTFPSFFLFLLLAYTFGGSLFLLIMIFGFFGWGSAARIIRAEALQRVEEPYIKAAKNSGASTFWVLRRHILPNVSNSIITAATLTVPVLILSEAAFAFLGLGDPTVYSWGQMISDGRNHIRNAWWISTFPGVFLFFTILAFNFLGDALRDALDPRHGGKQ